MFLYLRSHKKITKMTVYNSLSNQIKFTFCFLRFKKCLSSGRFAMILLIFSTAGFSQENKNTNWSQFRGNLRNGASSETGSIQTWAETSPQLLWIKDVGNGFPEVTIAAGVAYIFSSDSLEGGYEYIEAIDAETGKTRWKTKIDSMYFEVDGWGHGPRSTPAIDEAMIWCLSGFGKLTALSVKDGSKIWTVDLPKEFGTTQPRWGFSSSPLLIENLLIMETGGPEERAFTAFDKKTGKTIWSKGIGPAFYSSPAIADINNQKQVVFASDTMLYAYNLSGNLEWAYKMPLRSPTAMPLFVTPDKFFVSTISDTGSFMIRFDNNKVSRLWSSPAMQNEWSTSCCYNGYLYGMSKTKLVCISAETGEMKWGQRGFGKGSLIISGNKLIVLSDQGVISLIEASPEKFTKIGSFQALKGKSWTAPSFADGKLFVRNLSNMSCFKLSN